MPHVVARDPWEFSGRQRSAPIARRVPTALEMPEAQATASMDGGAKAAASGYAGVCADRLTGDAWSPET